MSVVSVAAAGVGLGVGLNTLFGNPLGLGGGGGSGQQAQQMVDPFAPYRASYAQLLNQYMGLGVGGPTGGAPAPSPQPAAGSTGGMNLLPLITNHTRGGATRAAMFGRGASPLAAPSAPAAGAATGPTSGGAPPHGGISPTFGLNDPAYQASLDIGLQGVQRANPGASGNELLALQNFGINYQNQFSTQMFDRLATLSGASTSPAVGGQAGVNAANLSAANQSQGLGMALGGMQGLGKYFSTPTSNPDPGVNPAASANTPTDYTNYFGTGSMPQIQTPAIYSGGGGF